MKRLACLLLLVAGCSTAPVADVMDFFHPGRIAAGKGVSQGGVCGPQQPGPPTIGTMPVPAPVFPGFPAPLGAAPPTPVLGAPAPPITPPPVATMPPAAP